MALSAARPLNATLANDGDHRRKRGLSKICGLAARRLALTRVSCAEMSTVQRILLTVFALVAFALAAYALRPSQRFPVSFRHFKLGANDPFYRLLYSPSGHPRTFAWVLPVVVACISVAGIWLVLP